MAKTFLLPLLAALLAAGSAWWSTDPGAGAGASAPTAAVHAVQSGAGKISSAGSSAQDSMVGDQDGGAASGGVGVPGPGPTTQGGAGGDPDG
jgi:hypothetical protein